MLCIQFEDEHYRVFLINTYSDFAQHIICEVSSIAQVHTRCINERKYNLVIIINSGIQTRLYIPQVCMDTIWSDLHIQYCACHKSCCCVCCASSAQCERGDLLWRNLCPWFCIFELSLHSQGMINYCAKGNFYLSQSLY